MPVKQEEEKDVAAEGRGLLYHYMCWLSWVNIAVTYGNGAYALCVMCALAQWPIYNVYAVWASG